MADKSIRAVSSTISAMSTDWPMIDALMDGTPAMRAAGKAFLPKWPKEEQDAYDARLATAVLHPVFKRTVLVNAARPFSKAMTFGDKTPPKIQEWIEDIDQQGTSLAAFSVQAMVACLSKGLHGVLVDYPKAEAVKTKADEKAAGVRPYWVHYPAGTILGWKTVLGKDGLQFSQLRLLEAAEVEDGAYGIKTVEQVRVLSPGKWETYRQNKDNQDIWDLAGSGTTTLPVVPFVFFYGIRSTFGVGHSPMRDLAFQNVEHWQSASDQQTILHVARVPILFLKNFETDKPINIGAGCAISADGEHADAKYVEHSGNAIQAGKESLIDLQDRMRSSGAELISLLPAYTTATQVSSDTEATKSLLQQIVEVFEESVEACLNLMAAWVNEDETAEVAIYKDFGALTDTDPQVLNAAAAGGSISKQTHFEELQRRDVVAADRTWEDELARLELEAPDETDPGEGIEPKSRQTP